MTTLVEFFVEGRRPRPTQTGSIAMKTIQVRGPFGPSEPKRVPYPTRRNPGWVDEFTLKAKRFRPRNLLTGPIAADLTFVLPRPIRSRPDDLPMVPLTGGDPDNFAKGILDAMQGDFVYNDSMFSDVTSRKRWVGWRGYPTGVLVRLSRIEATDVA